MVSLELGDEAREHGSCFWAPTTDLLLGCTCFTLHAGPCLIRVPCALPHAGMLVLVLTRPSSDLTREHLRMRTARALQYSAGLNSSAG